jgi:thioredoxin reductase (NADPH)
MVVIIGGGPIGMACGIACKNAGLAYIILEKGCLVNSLYHYPTTMTFFSTSERLELGNIPFVSNSAKPTRAEALEYYRRVAQHQQLNIHLFEEVVDVKQNTKGFTVVSSKKVYDADQIILATGFYDLPNLLGIPGETLPKVRHYYKDPHYYAFQDILVVGANNSAVDVALETFRKGAAVTMVVREAEIGKTVKYWVRPDIENRIAEGSIKAYFNSNLKEVREHEVVLSTPDGEVVVPNQWVLAMTGYTPNLNFLQRLGIALADDAVRKPVYNEDTMETNVPGLYLAGVICGGLDTRRLFIENSREHALKIAMHISRIQQ